MSTRPESLESNDQLGPLTHIRRAAQAGCALFVGGMSLALAIGLVEAEDFGVHMEPAYDQKETQQLIEDFEQATSLDVETLLPGWVVAVYDGKNKGLCGITHINERVIEVWDCDRRAKDETLAHELGHADDIENGDGKRRRAWKQQRDIEAHDWWPSHSDGVHAHADELTFSSTAMGLKPAVPDSFSGAGDYAEGVMCYYFAGTGASPPIDTKSKIGGACTQEDIAFVGELLHQS